MSARALIFVVIALVMAGATAMIARNYLSSERAQLSAQAKPAPQQVTKNVLVAAADLPAGSFIKAEQVRWQPWPEDAVGDSYLLEGTAKPEDVVGAVVRRGGSRFLRPALVDLLLEIPQLRPAIERVPDLLLPVEFDEQIAGAHGGARTHHAHDDE